MREWARLSLQAQLPAVGSSTSCSHDTLGMYSSRVTGVSGSNPIHNHVFYMVTREKLTYSKSVIIEQNIVFMLKR